MRAFTCEKRFHAGPLGEVASRLEVVELQAQRQGRGPESGRGLVDEGVARAEWSRCVGSFAQFLTAWREGKFSRRRIQPIRRWGRSGQAEDGASGCLSGSPGASPGLWVRIRAQTGCGMWTLKRHDFSVAW